jgi:hypothetical protein
MPLNSTAFAFDIKVFGFITGGTYVVVGDKYRIVVDNESLLRNCEAQGFPGLVQALQPEIRS